MISNLCCLVRTEVDQLFSSAHDKSGWMTSWNVRHSFSSPSRVHEIMRPAAFLPGAVKELEIQTRRVLARYLGMACKEQMKRGCLPVRLLLYQICVFNQNFAEYPKKAKMLYEKFWLVILHSSKGSLQMKKKEIVCFFIKLGVPQNQTISVFFFYCFKMIYML